eukprot:TRINITY_DN10677_c0_g1_i2.p1 TRINITY_DN10677_c0_g1~~TRINITY_DN10677_c0_g1_i2.p1  ORF type:complete len:121 (+),score=28.55 TRINITY_DN10677_c0_g1_i2:230-592(+)
MEKIDKYRQKAFKALCYCIHQAKPPIEHYDILAKSIPVPSASNVDSEFPILVPLLSLKEYTKPVMQGAAASLGGMGWVCDLHKLIHLSLIKGLTITKKTSHFICWYESVKVDIEIIESIF